MLLLARGDDRSAPRRMSWTLSRYLARRLVQGMGSVLIALLLIGFFLDAVEQIRRISGDPDASLSTALVAATLRLPYLAERLLPFAMLFGALIVFHRLTRSHELVAARAAGVSVWQFLAPATAVALVAGVLAVTVLNPISAALYGRYQNLQQAGETAQEPQPTIAAGGIWLKHQEGRLQYIINAAEITDEPLELRRVVVFSLHDGATFVGRIDAARARLEGGSWRLFEVVRTAPDGAVERAEELLLPTRLSRDRIQQSLRDPETISFWALPAYTELLRAVGFPTRRHVLQFQSLLAKPLLLCAMLVIGTVFSLRFARRGGTWLLIAAGLVAGFAFYALADVVLALGLSGRLPAAIAAWTPALIAILLGAAMLFYLEDG